MNLTRIALVFVLISVPFMMISHIRTEALQKSLQTTWQYKRIINNAVDDGAQTLRRTAVAGAPGDMEIAVDPEEVVASFLASYHYGFNASSDTDRVRLDHHLTALLITDYDGFYIYGVREVFTKGGNRVLTHVLSEKQAYVYEDSSHLIHLTLGDRLRILDKHLMTEMEGIYAELALLPASVPSLGYELWRQQVVTRSLVEALERTVSLHNRYGRDLGLTYEFHLPLGSEDALAQSVKGPGVYAFVQGQPLGGGRYLEWMAFGQGSISLAEGVTGYKDSAGNLYYCDSSCSPTVTDPEVKKFSSGREAASEGFYPCYILGIH